MINFARGSFGVSSGGFCAKRDVCLPYLANFLAWLLFIGRLCRDRWFTFVKIECSKQAFSLNIAHGMMEEGRAFKLSGARGGDSACAGARQWLIGTVGGICTSVSAVKC